MSLPNSRGQSLSRDVAQDHPKSGSKFHHLEKISRKMADRKNLTSNLVSAPVKFAGSAELALNLGGFKDGLLQFGVIPAERIQFIRKKLRALRQIASSSSQSLR